MCWKISSSREMTRYGMPWWKIKKDFEFIQKNHAEGPPADLVSQHAQWPHNKKQVLLMELMSLRLSSGTTIFWHSEQSLSWKNHVFKYAFSLKTGWPNSRCWKLFAWCRAASRAHNKWLLCKCWGRACTSNSQDFENNRARQVYAPCRANDTLMYFF